MRDHCSDAVRDGSRRLYSAILDRQELVVALQGSAVLLRTMAHVYGIDAAPPE